MRSRWLWRVVSLALCVAAWGTAWAAEPALVEMDLFAGGQDNVNIYRIPSLVVAPSGTILAFIEAREGDDGDPT